MCRLRTSHLKQTGCVTKLSVLIHPVQKNHQEEETQGNVWLSLTPSFSTPPSLLAPQFPSYVSRSALAQMILPHTAHSRHATIFPLLEKGELKMPPRVHFPKTNSPLPHQASEKRIHRSHPCSYSANSPILTPPFNFPHYAWISFLTLC